MPDTVTVHSRSLTGGSRTIRPINNQILTAPEGNTTSFGKLVIITNDKTVDVVVSRVLAVSPKAKANTRKGPVKYGDRVLSVRVVNKKIDDIDLRLESGQRVAFLADEHCLAVLGETEIIPVNDCMLVRGQPDRREYEIILTGSNNLEVVSCEVMATGPDCTQGEPGEFAVHPNAFGVKIDSIEVRKRFGSDLKLIREKSVTGIASVQVEGEAYPEILPDRKPLI